MDTILMRHCESTYSIDKPLSENGVRQAYLCASELKKNYELSNILCSTCDRAVATATIIAEEFGVQIEKLEELREREHGSFIRDPQLQTLTFLDDAGKRESIDTFLQRVIRFRNYYEKNFNEYKNILIVSHGGFIKLFMTVIGIRPIEFKNGQMLQIRKLEKKYKIIKHIGGVL